MKKVMFLTALFTMFSCLALADPEVQGNLINGSKNTHAVASYNETESQQNERTIAEIWQFGNLTLQFQSKLSDNLYPDEYFGVIMGPTIMAWNSAYYETEEWSLVDKGIANEMVDTVVDITLNNVGETIQQFSWWQSLEGQLRKRLNLTFRNYFREPEGPYGEKPFAVDASFRLYEEDRSSFDAGITFEDLTDPAKDLTDPALFTRFELGKNGNGGQIIHEVRYEMLNEQIAYYMRGLNNFNWRLQYDIPEDELDFNFLDLPLGKLGNRFAGRLDLSHNFKENSWGVILGIFTKF